MARYIPPAPEHQNFGEGFRKGKRVSRYELSPGQITTLDRPLKGYRIEQVAADGLIGYYKPNGLTPVAHCDPRYRHAAKTISDVLSMNAYMAANPALTHDPSCTYCGHRIVRSLKELADFVAFVAASHEAQNSFMNHAQATRSGSYFAVVECTVPAGGAIAHRNLEDQELPGTIRADRLQLGTTVTMPRYFGRLDQTVTALRTGSRYQVKVRQPDIGDLDLINSFMPPGSLRLQEILANNTSGKINND